ncbi:hypothetical protein HK405_013589, partial [Cladochytrium tenue]
MPDAASPPSRSASNTPAPTWPVSATGGLRRSPRPSSSTSPLLSSRKGKEASSSSSSSTSIDGGSGVRNNELGYGSLRDCDNDGVERRGGEGGAENHIKVDVDEKAPPRSWSVAGSRLGLGLSRAVLATRRRSIANTLAIVAVVAAAVAMCVSLYCLILDLKTTSVDFLSSRVGYNLRVYPGGKYIDGRDLMVGNRNVSLVIDNVERKLWTTPGMVGTVNQPNPFDFTVVSSGSVVLYPFDVHTNRFDIYAFEGSDPDSPIPICLQFRNIIENHEVSTTPAYVPADPSQRLSVTVSVRRNIATRIYSLFAGLLMWVLGASVSRFSIDAILDKAKQIEGPVMGVSVAVLFAVPALRNTQPNIPPIGVLADVYAFFWAELSVIFTGLTQIILYSVRKAMEKEARAREAEAREARAKAIGLSGAAAASAASGAGGIPVGWRGLAASPLGFRGAAPDNMGVSNAANAMDIWGGGTAANAVNMEADFGGGVGGGGMYNGGGMYAAGMSAAGGYGAYAGGAGYG